MVVVGKQLWYETYMVQALKNDNIRAVRCEDLAAEERIVMMIERLRDEVQDD